MNRTANWFSAPYRGILSLLVLLVCQGEATRGQSCYEAAPGSQLTVSGSAKIRSFSCVSTAVDGRAIVPGSPTDSLEIELKVPVRSFDCGRSAMNEDLYEALQADKHPYIRYRLHRVQGVSSPDPAVNRMQIVGTLTMAGTARRDTTLILGESASDGRMRVEGSTTLSLRRFNVTPPTALFGLIQVEDAVTVSADLLGTPGCEPSG